MGYVSWLKQEHLEGCVERMIHDAMKKADLALLPHVTKEQVTVLTEAFLTHVATATAHITDVADGRQQYVVRSYDVVHAAHAVGVKLYGYDAPDDSRLALLHRETDDVVESEPPHIADDDVIYSAPVESSDSDSSDSDTHDDNDDDTVSLGDGEFSDCEAPDTTPDHKHNEDNPYALPRRVMLRLFRDSCTLARLEAWPITRKALSAFHNLAETLLCPLVASCLQELASQPAPVPTVHTTPTVNRRAGGKKRMSGDVFPSMADASQKRKSPRLAHKSMRVHLDFLDDTKSSPSMKRTSKLQTRTPPPSHLVRRPAAARA
ncbi:hypothetical protein DYB30_012606 [Aphanomyces astaci]|uniref:Uncharacterized protein n=3 Tax=Aphanomyces astaci TaxID=112090 RepID=A0A397DWQ6_APHAT|nr:hypothetical protein DYB38_011962 [Aphanomyces astaci]RHY71978.1 hypothetical protein DYB30_012606 [Aphanomyces astaci]RHZ03927.1 hypothetical protein DYB31_013224 [Aphanomyces astaci]